MIHSSMIDFVKNTLLAGLGATVVTAEKVESVLQELVEKGKISAEESKTASRRIIDEGRKEFERSQNKLNMAFNELLEKSPVVFRKDFEALEKRVELLEKEIAKSGKSAK